MATLLTHLGLILFLVAAAVTSRLGDEQGLVVAEGDSLTVQPIGTPGLLLVKNFDFEAPGFSTTGQATDFTTDLGRLPGRPARSRARRSGSTTRCRSPATRSTRTASGRRRTSSCATAPARPLWDGPVPLTDSAAGLPYGTLAVPGRDLGLQLLLDREADGHGRRPRPARTGSSGTDADGTPIVEHLRRRSPLHAGDARASPGARPLDRPRRRSATTRCSSPSSDPGQGLVWIGLRAADRRDRDHVLPAAPAGLGPARARRASWRIVVALRPLRRRRARVRAAARRPRRGPRRPHLTRPATPSTAIVQHPQPSAPTVDTEPQPGPAASLRQGVGRNASERCVARNTDRHRPPAAP